jgi:hypothetical protein
VTRAEASIPEPAALICERCGYILTGLADDAVCPECGTAIAESRPELRQPAAWEARPGVGAFLSTTWDVLFRPTRFFRGLTTRDPLPRARQFAWIHWGICSVIFALTAFRHNSIGASSWWTDIFSGSGVWMRPTFYLLVVGTFFMIAVTTHVAVRLTAWEAAYRGLRLPHNAAMRALYFHAAHYLPVAVGAFATVFGFAWLMEKNLVSPINVLRYVYVIGAEVLVGAGYLFKTYWIGMRNIMFANR